MQYTSRFKVKELFTGFQKRPGAGQLLPVASEQLSYDRNGNIASISRILGTESEAVPDTRDYFGNWLSVLVEDETDYTFEYDLNGAMTYDGKNRVTLTRNILGQPYLLEQAGGACVEFSYLADGTKRYMVADTFEGPQYYGSFIYRYDEAAGETFLESIAHPEGRFAVTSYTSQDEPVYSNLHYVTDRVGSTVAIVDADADAYSDVEGTVLEGNGYTPFGERFDLGGLSSNRYNRFRFNGKEDMSRFQLPYIDYGARYYDLTVARWHRPDPMADKYPDTSPYAFCANDPVNFVDLNGQDIWEIDSYGFITWKETSENHIVYFVDKNGERTEKSVSLESDALLSNYFDKRVDHHGYTRHYSSWTSNNRDDVFNFFAFVTENTCVEWAIHRVADQYTVATIHSLDSAGAWQDYGIEQFPDFSMHSHPNTPIREELHSMGYGPGVLCNTSDKKKMDAGFAPVLNYVYFPKSRHVYLLRKGKTPQRIRPSSIHSAL